MLHRPLVQSRRMIQTCAELQIKIPPRLRHCQSAPIYYCYPPRVCRVTSAGINVNQSPNADQKGASLDNERILYERITCGETRSGEVWIGAGAVRCSNVRSSGPISSGKYTYCTVRHSSCSHTRYGGGRNSSQHTRSLQMIWETGMRPSSSRSACACAAQTPR